MIVRIYILPDYLRGSISPSIVRTSGQNLPDDLQGPFKYSLVYSKNLDGVHHVSNGS